MGSRHRQGVGRRANAIQNRIKTYFTLYSSEEQSGELPSAPEMNPMRYSECSVESSIDTIESDVVLPETRIPSTPETGSQSNAGDVTTEWNIDEQDPWFAGVFCGSWTDETDGSKKLTLGDATHSFSLLKKYPQAPVAYQWYKKDVINQLTIDFATNAFVKLTWSFMGSNAASKVTADPLASLAPVYKPALTTKSFLTRTGFIKLGDTVGSLVPMRQCPSMSITINNNMETTPALFEEESIENSLGNFEVSGSIEVYNADDKGHELYNAAMTGADKVLQVQVAREVGGQETSYTLTLNIHLSPPSESKDGNKLKFSMEFKVNAVTDLSLVKRVA